jgi:hypothetical protein
VISTAPDESTRVDDADSSAFSMQGKGRQFEDFAERQVFEHRSDWGTR